jgi:hypothetical protein
VAFAADHSDFAATSRQHGLCVNFPKMAETKSITTVTVHIISLVRKVTNIISKVVTDVRESRKDLVRVSGELSSLRVTLQVCYDDGFDLRVTAPANVQDRMVSMISECTNTLGDLESLLLGVLEIRVKEKVEWAATVRSEIYRLRSTLEAHKMALNLDLDLLYM